MVSNDFEESFENGKWVSKAQAAVHFNVTERTVENRIKTGIPPSRVIDGKTEVFIRNSKNSSKDSETEFENTSKEFEQNKKDSKEVENSSKLFEQVLSLSEKFEKALEENNQLRNQLSEALQKVARLEGEAKGKDDLIKSKDETIASKDETIASDKRAMDAMNYAALTWEKSQPNTLQIPAKIDENPPKEKKRWWPF